ncbi:MAG TPA: hypothetical protein VEC01_05485 [Noviherbaspirillum sp.]|uniref:beta strand repeat-containing protein n=1 Tax=Noviherbaspirillum sp. TaxID=1926288 RepID=UPI002D58A9E8|nr:hypothetical protein [Noviherbaspirillum sp.]HYD94758.1 hypothetical protein [Noviherbaspirillum sp.]
MAAPVITGIAFDKTTGTLKIGDVLVATITADSPGYTAGDITINGKAITAFTDNGDGTYAVTYTVSEGDGDIAGDEAIPVSVVLVNDTESNTAFTDAPAAGDAPAVDAHAPAAVSIIRTDEDSSSTYTAGDKLTITLSEAVADTLAVEHLALDNGHSFGTGASISAVDATEGNASVFEILLGTSPTVAAGDIISIDKSVLADTADNVPDNDLTFTVPQIDETAPTASVTTATIKPSGNAMVRSSETGTAYLVKSTVSVASLADLIAAADEDLNSVSIDAANTDTALAATGLSDGTYQVYTVDAAGNLSAASNDSVIVDGTAPDAPTLTKVGQGFSVDAGAAVTITVDGQMLDADGVNAAFTKTTAGGLDIYTAKADAFDGSEDIDLSATLTDAAGNVSAAGALDNQSFDTTAPATPTLTKVGQGFSVDAGAAVTITVDGQVLDADGVNDAFIKTTAGGLDTYSAKVDAFDGSEDIDLSATLTDAAGNVSAADSLDNQSFDTIAPATPTLTKVGQGFSVDAGAAVTVTVDGQVLDADGVDDAFIKTTAGGLDTYAAKVDAFDGDEDIDLRATLTDAAGNISTVGSLDNQTFDTTAPAAPTLTKVSQGFSVDAGAAVTITVNGQVLNTDGINAAFTKTTAGGVDTYAAKVNAFDGTEDIDLSATLTDAAGNISTASSLDNQRFDTTAPASPTLAKASQGFTVDAGAAVTITVDGQALNADGVNAAFTKTTASGIDTYAAKVDAFDGDEDIDLRATLTDAAGNISTASSLDNQRFDTTAPAAPTLTKVSQGFSVDAGAAVTITVDGQVLDTDGINAAFTKTTAGGVDTYAAKADAFDGDEDIDLSATLTDAAGNISTASSLDNQSFDTTAPASPTLAKVSQGFTVDAGAAVTITVDGQVLDANGINAAFTKTTASGIDTYAAKADAFDGDEDIDLRATLTDAAGNISTVGSLDNQRFDTTAPAAPTLTKVGQGFSVDAGAAVTITVDGQVLDTDGINAAFTKTTAGGLDTYSASADAFDGNEDIDLSATLTDTAGNTSTAGTLDNQSFDTTGPSASVMSATIKPSVSTEVQSSETGTAFLVKSTVTVASLADLAAAADEDVNSIAIDAANRGIALAATGLSDGTYKVYAVDAAGNLSEASNDSVVIDSAAPAASVITAVIKPSGSALVQSTETGVAYLVNSAVNVTSVADITGSGDNNFNPVAISSANTLTELAATGLSDGIYMVYTEDSAGNLSVASMNSVTIDGTAPTASVMSATIAPSGNAVVQSTETGTAYLVLSSVTVNSVADITGADDDNFNSAAITTVNAGTSLAATGLSSGIYTVYTADAAGNLSIASTNTVTVDGTAPTVTTTGGTYSAGTDTLVIFGEGFSTLLESDESAATDIKSRLDWAKLVWDTNGDDAVTANVSFAANDISSAKVVSDTALKVVLTSAKAAALEAGNGFGTIANSLDIAAGFALDMLGNATTTDTLENGPLSIQLNTMGVAKTETQYNILDSTATNVTVAAGEVMKVYDAADAQEFVVDHGGTLHLSGAQGSNVITLSGYSLGDLTVSRSGTTAFFWVNGEEVASIGTSSTAEVQIIVIGEDGFALEFDSMTSAMTLGGRAIGLVGMNLGDLVLGLL